MIIIKTTGMNVPQAPSFGGGPSFLPSGLTFPKGFSFSPQLGAFLK